MPRFRPDPVHGGDLVSAAQFNQVADLAEYGANLTADPTSDLVIIQGPSGPMISAVETPHCVAKITGPPVSGVYPWSQVVATPGGGWLVQGATGTTTLDGAYERNGNASVPVNEIVPMRRECGEWRFDWMACS